MVVNSVWDLVSHVNTMFDCGRNWVYDTFTGEKIAERADWVHALASHKKTLYDGGRDGI